MDTPHELYADKNNVIRVYELKKMMATNKQGDKTVAVYQIKLRSHRQEPAHYDGFIARMMQNHRKRKLKIINYLSC